MSHSSKKILILADNRAGTYSQAINLAQEIGAKIDILPISYSKFIKIPNFILPRSLFRYDAKTKETLKNISNFPDIILSAGRRSVSGALFLKKKSQNKTKIIQIMDPNICANRFDLTILPIHDCHKKHPKIINSIGAITRLDQDKIAEAKHQFAEFFQKIDKKKIVLLLGGPSKNTNFSDKSTINLADISSKLANNLNAKLIILTSPRTTQNMLNVLRNQLKCDYHIFDYEEHKENNPYFACLGYGDLFVVSADSVSMISECCGLGKKVAIFDESEISSDKHKRFHAFLYDNGYAVKLSESVVVDDGLERKRLNEAKRLAGVIEEFGLLGGE